MMKIAAAVPKIKTNKQTKQMSQNLKEAAITKPDLALENVVKSFLWP